MKDRIFTLRWVLTGESKYVEFATIGDWGVSKPKNRSITVQGRLNNPDFKPVEFDGIRMQAGLSAEQRAQIVATVWRQLEIRTGRPPASACFADHVELLRLVPCQLRKSTFTLLCYVNQGCHSEPKTPINFVFMLPTAYLLFI